MSTDEVRRHLGHAGAVDLVTAHVSGMVATYLPTVFDPDAGEHGALLMHVARNNRQWSEATVAPSLAIVHGVDHYVSPRWMPSFAEHAQVVPTWNYLTVHVYGDLVARDDAEWTLDLVRRLTEVHEGDPTGYSVESVPTAYLHRQLRAIVGLELRITRIEAKAKMSQNKMPVDVSGVIDGLRSEVATDGARGTASWMQAHSLPAARRREALLADVASRRRPSPPPR